MTRMLALLLAMLASPAFTTDDPPSNGQGYCVGVSPENCSYSWTFDGDRWHYDGAPMPKEARRESREEATGTGEVLGGRIGSPLALGAPGGPHSARYDKPKLKL
jgi:hypothetical protein